MASETGRQTGNQSFQPDRFPISGKLRNQALFIKERVSAMSGPVEDILKAANAILAEAGRVEGLENKEII